MILGLWQELGTILRKCVINITAGFYQLINMIYQVFLTLAENTILDSDAIVDLSNKVYLVLGVIVLFMFSYNVLTYIIDPDKGKGDSSLNIFKNIITTVILIILIPTIFTYASKFQTAILVGTDGNGGVIERLFSKDGDAVEEECKVLEQEDSCKYESKTLKIGGRRMALTAWQAFWNIEEEDIELSEIVGSDGQTFKEVSDEILCSKSPLFSKFTVFADNWTDGEVSFSWLMAIFASFFLGYFMISFCFDVGIRQFKLAYYELIAPICVACRVLPKSENIFKNWMNAVIKTYTSVFIRVFTMDLLVYFISILFGRNSKMTIFAGKCTPFVGNTLSKVIILLSLVTFAKMLPKLIEETFGLGGDMKLGIKDKFMSGFSGYAGMASTLGSGFGAITRNAAHRKNELVDARDARKKARQAAWRSGGVKGLFTDADLKNARQDVRKKKKPLRSNFGASLNGFYQGYQNSKGITSFNEIGARMEKSADAETDYRDKIEGRRNRYIEEHGGIKDTGVGQFIAGNVSDRYKDAKDFLTGGFYEYNKKIERANKMKTSNDALKASTEALMNKYRNSHMLFPKDDDGNNIMGISDKYKWKNDEDGAIAALYATCKGMSIAEMEDELQALRNADIFKLIDKDRFYQESYARAISYPDDYAWKKDEDGAIAALYASYKGRNMNIPALEAEFEALKRTDVATLVDRSSFAPGAEGDAAYQAAVTEVTTKHNKKINAFDSMLSQIKDNVDKDFENLVNEKRREQTKKVTVYANMVDQFKKNMALYIGDKAIEFNKKVENKQKEINNTTDLARKRMLEDELAKYIGGQDIGQKVRDRLLDDNDPENAAKYKIGITFKDTMDIVQQYKDAVVTYESVGNYVKDINGDVYKAIEDTDTHSVSAVNNRAGAFERVGKKAAADSAAKRKAAEERKKDH